MATIQNNTMYGMRLQFRGQNANDWSADYVLLAGEVGFELDTKKYKLGDGTKTWSQLDYYSEPTITAAVEALTTRVSTAESDIASLQSRMSTAEGNIQTNAGNIATNAGNIATNTGNIAANAADIAELKGVTVISGNPAPAAGA